MKLSLWVNFLLQKKNRKKQQSAKSLLEKVPDGNNKTITPRNPRNSLGVNNGQNKVVKRNSSKKLNCSLNNVAQNFYDS